VTPYSKDISFLSTPQAGAPRQFTTIHQRTHINFCETQNKRLLEYCMVTELVRISLRSELSASMVCPETENFRIEQVTILIYIYYQCSHQINDRAAVNLHYNRMKSCFSSSAFLSMVLALLPDEQQSQRRHPITWLPNAPRSTVNKPPPGEPEACTRV
jgi:hypothetical protein